MKALILIICCLLLAACENRTTEVYLHKPTSADSVALTIYTATIITTGKQDIVFIDNELDNYRSGDTVEVNANKVIPAYEEPANGLHWIILRDSIGVKVFSRDDAEGQQ